MGKIWLWIDKTKKLVLLHEPELLNFFKETGHLTEEDLNKDSNLRAKLSQILNHEEVYWKQRTRTSWLKEGDENISFFHLVTNGLWNRNFIPWVLHENNRVVDRRRIGVTFTAFYKHLCGSTKPSVLRSTGITFLVPNCTMIYHRWMPHSHMMRFGRQSLI